MKNMKKKGFTLVELLVVIAIVAILAAVSVVGYTVFIGRANMSADQQAVTQMNTMLEALDVNNEPEDLKALYEYLNQTGLTAEDYKPLSKDHIFVWDIELNRILLVKDDKVVYPEEYIETAVSTNWYNLKADEMKLGSAPAVNDSGAVAFGSASDLITTFKNPTGVSSVNLTKDINLMGASAFIDKAPNDMVIDGKDKTIYNLVSSEFATIGKAYKNDTSADNQKYASGFIGTVTSGKKVVIKNVTFEGLTIGDYETGSVGALIGTLGGELELVNVTFKNCTIYGQNKVGILVGQVQSSAKITLTNVTVEDCTVISSEAEAGKLFGTVTEGATISGDCKVTNTNVEVVEFGAHKFVTIDGVKYITKVNGNGDADVKTLDGASYTAVCKVPSENAVAFFYPTVHGYVALGNGYCGRPAQEMTTISGLTITD